MRYRQSYKAQKEQLEMEKIAMVAAGLVSERYAGVSSIEFRMTYFRRGLNPVLMKRTLSFSPANYACFHLKCLHEGCTGGGYDLTPMGCGAGGIPREIHQGKALLSRNKR